MFELNLKENNIPLRSEIFEFDELISKNAVETKITINIKKFSELQTDSIDSNSSFQLSIHFKSCGTLITSKYKIFQ